MPQRPTGPFCFTGFTLLNATVVSNHTPPLLLQHKRHKFRVWVLFYKKNILLQFFFPANKCLNILEFILLDFFLIHGGLPHPSVTQDSTLE